MKQQSKFSQYQRKAFLATIAPARRAIALQLCELLEAAFTPKEISVYAGFPIVVRDMEWIAGFAMRASGPIAYCCSPPVLVAMGAELAPYMSGKSCIAVKAKKGGSLDEVLALVGRAFREASKHGGMISTSDKKKREKLRAAATSAPKAKKSTSKKHATRSAAGAEMRAKSQRAR